MSRLPPESRSICSACGARLSLPQRPRPGKGEIQGDTGSGHGGAQSGCLFSLCSSARGPGCCAHAASGGHSPVEASACGLLGALAALVADHRL